jgi:serine/threonine protein kinase
MSDERTCSQCGSRLPAGESECPQCLLLLGMGDTQETPVLDSGIVPGAPLAPAETPERIGPYRVLEKIGEGGMGVVYLAEQEAPIRRRVAVKVIKLGMDTRQVIARFEGERQALALMSHPNVARVLDAGATGRGRPYFVMEYVDGVPISDWCDAHQLDLRERLGLFRQACDAIQHAHQKGIVHRDVKPSNVLVTRESERPTVKVIDFGVAKAIDQQSTERTVFTHHGMMVGTPEFMSPEQASGDPAAVDTRTDVYGLGVLLYLLAVGVLPFDTGELRRAAYDEIRRRIREDDPPRPSTRLSGLGAASGAAARARSTDPGSLVRELRGDLDWIVMKALDKQPERRYGSPSELAADLERHLHDQPVEARPPSAGYKLAKLVRRHRVAVAAAAAVLLALVAGAGVAAWQAVRATRAEQAALREAETAHEVAGFLISLFEVADPEVARGEDLTARQILEQGRLRIEGELADRPLVRARMMSVIGDIYDKLNLFPEAAPLLEGALEERRRLLGEDHPEVARSLHQLGRLRGDAGDDAAAEPLLRRAAELYDAALGPGSVEWAAVADDLSHTLRRTGRVDEALELQHRVLAARQAALGEVHEDVADSFSTLAALHYEKGEFETTIDYHRRALAMHEATLGGDHPQVAMDLSRLGAALGRVGRHDEEEPLHLRSVAIYEKVYGRRNSLVASGYNNLASLRARQGRLAEAAEGFAEALAIYEEIYGPGHTRLSTACKNLGRVLMLQGRYAEAEAILRRSLSIDEAGYGREHFWTGASHRTLSEVLKKQARWAEAEAHARQGLAVLEAAVGAQHFEYGQTLKSLGEIEVGAGRPAAAVEHLRQAVAVTAAAAGADSPAAGECMESLGEALLATGGDGETAEARELLERSLVIADEKLGAGHPTTVRTYLLLAEIHAAAGDGAEAERLARRALEIAETVHGPDHLDVAAALESLARLLAARGGADAATARDLYRRALAVRRGRLGDAHPDTAATAAALARLERTSA